MSALISPKMMAAPSPAPAAPMPPEITPMSPSSRMASIVPLASSAPKPVSGTLAPAPAKSMSGW